ncbi:MAG: HlyD family efflux transporter periplasmic adaptor subunit [Saprospiraceae bacterium]|nr:HlyD family efflux transporter periplasmic adaptor subunit [Saprospiraceae bacterium]
MSLPAESRSNEIVLNDREQIQYLLGNPPSWMTRYGISVMAGIFLILLALSYFIHYPDTIEADIVLTTANPPIRVAAKSSGRVTGLLVSDRQAVKKGEILAVLENTARWRDVLFLESWLDSTGGKAAGLPAALQLGELQGEYSVFSQHWKDLDYFALHNGVLDRIGYLQAQISSLKDLGINLKRQISTMQEEFALATKAYQRQQALHSSKVISDKEFETSEALYLSQKRQIENTEAALLQNSMQIKQTEAQINDLRQGKSDNQNEKELALSEDILRLRSAIAQWKQTYLVVAPIDGRVSFSRIWSAQQAVNAGEEVLAVVPGQAGPSGAGIVGKASASALNSGKIEPGQRAIIRLDGYPSQQFGVLETQVANISLLPQKDEKDAAYAIDLLLADPLVTSYGITIPFRQEMPGQVRIITEDRRVLERIFGSLRDLLQNR